MKKTVSTLVIALAISACSSVDSASNAPNDNARHHSVAPAHLDFAQQQGVQKSFEINGQTVVYRAFEQIVYVKQPADVRYQIMNIYIPEAYFSGGQIDGFNAQTAPIFFPNQVGGYMPAQPAKPELNQRNGNTPNAVMVALSKGYVVASAGARGRSELLGRAPAAIVDLKAAVRYLKANDAVMAGDANKIIANGTSAGGALSALLGTSGNAPEFAPYLRELGAADVSDDVFAVSSYCPITNLEHADAAYEWQFNGVNDYEKMDISMLDYHVERKLVRGTQTAAQIALSDRLKPLFPAYVNGLRLKNAAGELMTLDAQGNGSFKTQVATMLQQSAQAALDAGKDLSAQTWLKVANGKVQAVDFDAYARFVGRQKTAPAFDGVDLSTGENNLFGKTGMAAQHFTDFGMQNNTVAGATRADENVVRMMNAMNFQSKTQYYRIRHGANDRDTSLAIPTLLVLQLRNAGKTVDFALPWGQGHGGDYDLDELFAWTKHVATEK